MLLYVFTKNIPQTSPHNNIKSEGMRAENWHIATAWKAQKITVSIQNNWKFQMEILVYADQTICNLSIYLFY